MRSSLASKYLSCVTALFAVAMGSDHPRLIAQQGSAVVAWANTGEDKVTRDELRLSGSAPVDVRNAVWDGTTIRTFGGRNEVVSFNVIIEAPTGATGVSATFNALAGPGGATIASRATTGDGVFDFTGRNIELFLVRYLQIKGLSRVSYDVYDERHVPTKLRRPWTGQGYGSGGWLDRPNHDKFYPDIAVPLELVPAFPIPAGSNQSIWTDIYIPKTAVPGVYWASSSSGSAIPWRRPFQLNCACWISRCRTQPSRRT